ncbi:M4 family metallopeptidase [Asticcacaulis biprosthecium]|nr:M4 family metallopeptidase [Asticcacaulis biprosthecium]
MRHCRCANCFVPPQILKKLAESKNPDLRRLAVNSLAQSERLRGQRVARSLLAGAIGSAGDGRRSVFDCEGIENLNGARRVRGEGQADVADASVNRAFEGLGLTRDFYASVFGRDSIDDNGMRLNAYVHYGDRYMNAFWDGQQMVFGDGDGEMFDDFTKSLDVVAHELTHAVTEFSAGLIYHNQPGALNESMSDVFGVMVKQWKLKQTAEKADWLIGADIFTPGTGFDALRSLKAPGEAYDHPEYGRDPQPAHMNKYVRLRDISSEDWGGVHINSGIPNHAFYLAATAIGGYAWDVAGQIWYQALLASSPTTDFQAFADTTYEKAGSFGQVEQEAVGEAWRMVGIRVARSVSSRRVPRRALSSAPGSVATNDMADLFDQVDGLSKQVAALAEILRPQKGGR